MNQQRNLQNPCRVIVSWRCGSCSFSNVVHLTIILIHEMKGITLVSHEALWINWFFKTLICHMENPSKRIHFNWCQLVCRFSGFNYSCRMSLSATNVDRPWKWMFTQNPPFSQIRWEHSCWNPPPHPINSCLPRRTSFLLLGKNIKRCLVGLTFAKLQPTQSFCKPPREVIPP